jgi:hypothetical protein
MSHLIGAKKMQNVQRRLTMNIDFCGTVAEQGGNSIDILILRIDDYQRRV